jgi:hypothetical protein
LNPRTSRSGKKRALELSPAGYSLDHTPPTDILALRVAAEEVLGYLESGPDYDDPDADEYSDDEAFYEDVKLLTRAKSSFSESLKKRSTLLLT